MRPDLSYVKDVPFEILGLRRSENPHLHGPGMILLSLASLVEVTSSVIRVRASHS
jgi:hypothetical protein